MVELLIYLNRDLELECGSCCDSRIVREWLRNLL